MKDAGGAAVAGEKKSINAELWKACAGPLVNLPAAGTHVVYFPQGHSEQVAVSMRKEVDAKIPSYPNLDSKLICLLHNVTLHADPETDEVYAQMTLQPVSSLDKDALLRSDLALKTNKPPMDFFCKTLTASDTSTHGGFSVPRRAAEKIFPTLDFSMQPPAQEIVARDLHDNVWTFRHIFRGKPKRHLLTTGWSLFVSGKRLFAGDSVLFIRDEKQQLLLGIRRATRQPTNLSSSVLSSDSMHIGILAAAAHAAANSSPFTVFFNPRSTASEFVIPLAKYFKAVCSYQISLGMRFRMVFETEESGTRRYMGTITGISDLDPLRWKNSQWRNLQVGWDESTAGDRRNRVSIWEIEPVTAPFFICPPFFRPKRPRQPGMLDDDSYDLDNMFKRTMPWLVDDMYVKDNQALPGSSLAHWMNAPQNTSMGNSVQPNYMQSLSGSLLQDLAGSDLSRPLGMMLPQLPQPSTSQLISKRILQQAQVNEHLPKLPSLLNPLGSVIKPHQQLGDTTEQSTQNLPSSVFSSQVQGQPQTVAHNNNILHQQSSVQNHQFRGNLPPPRLQQQQQHLNRQQHIMGHNLETSLLQSQFPDLLSQQLSNNETQLQVLQKLQHQQSLVAQQSALQQPGQLSQLQKTKSQLLDASQSLCRSMTANQMLELPQTTDIAVLQPSIIQQQIIGNSSQSNAQFTHSPQVLKLQQQNPGILSDVISHTGVLPGSVTNQLSTAGSHMLTPATVAGQSRISGDVPSCSVSPSTNSCRNMVQPANSRAHQSTAIGSDMAQSAGTVLSPSFPESIPCNGNSVKNLHHKSDVRPSLNVAENQNQECFGRQAYINGSDAQMDYLDTSSSTTSVCLSQNDVHLQQNHNSLSYIPKSALISTLENGLYGTSTDGHLAVPLNHEDQFAKGMVGLDKDFSYNLSPGVMLDNCENSKDPQPELSSSMVSQSFDVPDMVFNSIDSTVNDISLSKRGSWAAVPQFQPMRTYTKVYKRGAVGRSIDISSYSGYNELKLDLAWRFGIEGQLEDHQRIGWKLVYVDHENDALLVGDDPWEEFVNCVRCIKILSPQEVQQMSLDGGLGNSIHQNQACSSSGNGNV